MQDPLSPPAPVFTETQKPSVQQQKFAIRLSLIVGFMMLLGKTYAYSITGSVAILSDAAESVIHVFAVSFAAFSLWLSLKPADESHPYGHEKVTFFSAGMEGMMIAIAAVYIVYVSIARWLSGLELQNLEQGTLFTVGAALINAGLGGYLVWQGKRNHSLILVANGKHVLTDSWTSFAVVFGLLLVLLTGWLPFDPITAIAAALNILWSGGKLVRQSIGGLMDEADRSYEPQLHKTLVEETQKHGLKHHEVRYRVSGATMWVEFHLLFPRDTTVEEAHAKATEVEHALKRASPIYLNVITHLEPQEEQEPKHH
jgi:cation diffusion facilitator family transporter